MNEDFVVAVAVAVAVGGAVAGVLIIPLLGRMMIFWIGVRTSLIRFICGISPDGAQKRSGDAIESNCLASP